MPPPYVPQPPASAFFFALFFAIFSLAACLFLRSFWSTRCLASFRPPPSLGRGSGFWVRKRMGVAGYRGWPGTGGGRVPGVAEGCAATTGVDSTASGPSDDQYRVRRLSPDQIIWPGKRGGTTMGSKGSVRGSIRTARARHPIFWWPRKKLVSQGV